MTSRATPRFDGSGSRLGTLTGLFSLLLLHLAACNAGHRANAPVVRTPRPAVHADPRRVATASVTLGADELPAASAALVAALRAPEQAGLAGRAQLLAPERFNAGSAIDLLRLSSGAGAPADEVRSVLGRIGWRWLLLQDGLPPTESGYRQWRVAILAFATEAGAAAYLRQPVLLSAALLQAEPAAAPAGLGSGAMLLAADYAVVPLNAPASSLAGHETALLWRRGRLVLIVEEVNAPPAADMAAFSAISQALAELAAAIPDG